MSKSIKELIGEEYVKCASTPIYFFKKYCYIQHPKRGKILFDLFQFQEDVMNELDNHQFNVILKSRQLGISTLSAGYSLWMMLFHNDKNVLVIATKQEVAKNLVTKVRYMHENLPSWLKGETIEDNKLSLRLGNGSQIKATSASGDAGRSEALSMLIIDEAAFIKNVDEIWASAQSTLSLVVKQSYYQLRMVLETSFIRLGKRVSREIVGIQLNYIGQYTLNVINNGEKNKHNY